MQDLSAIPVFDGHNDVLLALHDPRPGQERTFFERSSTGHIDLPRCREGGFGGGFFAVFVPTRPSEQVPEEAEPSVTPQGYEFTMAPAVDRQYALDTTLAMSALLFRLEAESEGALQVVRNAAQLRSCLESGVVAAVWHIEGVEALDTELNTLEVFYHAGLRSLGIVWSRPNTFGHGVPFKFPSSPDTGPGLTDAGKALVRECNRLGILVDLSHLNEAGFWDVAATSTAPLVATHSAAHAICASTRNLTDRQLDAVRDSDGMVGLNFSVGFIREDGGKEVDTPLDVMVRQVDYLVERLGIDRVGFGSDFDGTTVPAEIGDVTGLPKLMMALCEAGYDDAALRKLAYENWLRVLERTWR